MPVKQVSDAKEFFDRRVVDASDPRLSLFRDMIAFMEAIAGNDHASADAAIQRIIRDSRGDLYNEVGRVTRKLHDAIKGFKDGVDPRIRELATSEMPNAVDQLKLVMTETEQAANKTMGIVEKYIRILSTFDDRIKNIEAAPETARYLERFKAELQEDMTIILTTQQFQDLTGQTIKKVIALVADIENELLKLITHFSDAPLDTCAATPRQSPELVSQADVDDLLKELGF